MILCASGTGGFCCGFLFIYWFFLAAIGPNVFGLLLDTRAGSVAPEPVRGGLHRRWPWQHYITFPATQVSIIWADTKYFGVARHEAQIEARTGHEKGHSNDLQKNEAAGQPVDLSCALQYKYIPKTLPEVYKKLKSHQEARTRFMLVARWVVIAKAQDFSPQDFWQKREEINMEILSAMRSSLESYGVEVVRFEILKVTFANEFEDAVVQTQVEEQKINVNTFKQEVMRVVKSIDVLSAENQAEMATIAARASRTSKEMMANATTHAFNLKQEMKGKMYNEFKAKMNLTNKEMKEYVKIKSLLAKSQSGKVTLNMSRPKIKAAKKKKSAPARAERAAGAERGQRTEPAARAEVAAAAPLAEPPTVSVAGSVANGTSLSTLKKLPADDEVLIHAVLPSQSIGQTLLTARASGAEL